MQNKGKGYSMNSSDSRRIIASILKHATTKGAFIPEQQFVHLQIACENEHWC
jgi:hypothetical protein